MTTLGDIATIAAPTVVAVVAIGASTWQQSRSRTFDRGEREKEREHDRLMHERTETHERTIRDLDYQRALMDDAAFALTAVNSEFANIVTHVWVHGTPPSYEVMKVAGAATVALKLVIARVGLRLGAEHEIVLIMREAHAAMLLAAVQGLFDANDSGAVRVVRSTLHDAQTRISDAIDRFVIAVSKHTGTLAAAAAAHPRQVT